MTDTISKLGYLAGATRFRRISDKLYFDGDKIYRDHNINFKASWFSVFYTLAASAKAMTVNDLANEIGFTHITVKNVLRELETNRLVRIIPHPADGRSKHVTLTAKGKGLLTRLKPIWALFSKTLKHLLDTGHPDFINIINRIDKEIEKNPIHERLKTLADNEPVVVLDYKPALKKHFAELAGGWLLELLNGKLEEEDKFTLHNPDRAYLDGGGFVFFAAYKNKVVGCVALKRLDEDTFEFAKLYVDKQARNLGVATRLIERCISRCKENGAIQLWLQTTMSLPEAHKLYYKLGFDDRKAPKQMTVLKRTEKIMALDL